MVSVGRLVAGWHWTQRQVCKTSICLGALVLTCICDASPAQAFRCSQASIDGQNVGSSLAWPTRQLIYSLNSAGTEQLPVAQTLAVLRRAFCVWQNATLSDDANATCGQQPALTDIVFSEGPLSTESWTGYDYLDSSRNTNLVVFRDAQWAADPANSDIIALTTTTYSALTGVILDADIEFNSAQTPFALDDPNESQLDLMSTAVHEVGHFLGLAHCTTNPMARCGHNEVMEPIGLAGQTNKRRLSCDDRAGLVFKYARAAPNGYCADATRCQTGCLPPLLPAQVPKIRQSKDDMGRGCQASQVSPLGVLCCLWLTCYQMRRRRLWQQAAPAKLDLFVVFFSCAGLLACHPQATDCGGRPVAFDANAPLALSMTMMRQIQTDPWHVLLAIDFVDPDGDLGAGHLDYYANHSASPTQTLPMSDIFSASGGLAPDATSGRLQMLVRLRSTTPPGAVLHLSTQLVDARGHASNCYGIDLQFALQPSEPNVLLGTPVL